MIVLDLIYNLSLLIALSTLSGFISKRIAESFTNQIMQGVLFGIVALIGMIYPFVFAEGIIFDGRSIVISLCSLFFGPLAGGISALMAAVYRFSLGGSGVVMGISVITASYLIGVLFHFWHKKSSYKNITNLSLYTFGLIVHLAMSLLMLTLPGGRILSAMLDLGITIIVVYPFATLIIGKILLDQVHIDNYLSELKESESLLRTTLYSIGDGVIATNNKGEVQILNPIAEDLTGWKENEAHGKKLEEVFDIVNEETGNIVENSVIKVLREGVVVGLANHTLLINKNGKEIPIADSGAPIRNEDGEIIGVVLVFRDQTEEREYQHEISISEKKYKSLFNSIRDAILITDSKSNILGYNPAFKELFGYSDAELLGKNTQIIYKDKDEYESMTGKLHENMNEAEFLHIANFKKKNGSIFSGETNVFNLEDDLGNVTGLILLIRDITVKLEAERRLIESEDKMRLLVEGTPYLFFYTQDLDADITYISPSVEKITGRSVDEWMGQKHWWVTDNPINENAKKRTHSNLAGEITNEATWIEIKHKCGDPIMLEVYENPIIRDGKVVSLQGVAHDITVREKMIADLKSAKDNAEAANKLKTEFLAQMSHEIRSPLNAVLSFTSLLEEEHPGKDNPEVEAIFNGIVSSGRRIIKTIDSILNMSELQLGIYELVLRDIDLSDIVTNLLLEYKSQSSLKKIKLIKSIRAAGDPVIKGDDYAVTQIIANLIDNALKYTHEGKVEVSLYPENEENITVEISDTGIGIAGEYIPFLFDEFTQEQQGYTRMFEGNGLGLALVKKYCELINAQVSVESEKGKGSIFRVIFKRNPD